MGKKLNYILILSGLFLGSISFSQDLERKNIYYGNEAYQNQEFEEALEYYEEALKANPYSYKANFNLANAYFKLGAYQKASDLYSMLVDMAPTAYDRSKVYHNLGNAQLANQKLNDAINSYKEALKLNPSDEETRYNLAYALELKKEQQQQQQQQNQEQNENQDENQNENQDENQNENQDENQNENQDGNQDENQDENENQDGNQDGNQEKNENNNATAGNRISKEQAKRILDAALKKEKEVQKKLDKYKKVGTGVSSKKDW